MPTRTPGRRSNRATPMALRTANAEAGATAVAA